MFADFSIPLVTRYEPTIMPIRNKALAPERCELLQQHVQQCFVLV